MADSTQPNLGYGQRGEAPINAVNQWMRGTPWYNDLIRSFGQDPNNVHLNDQQKQQVIRAAQANGVVVDEGHDGQEIDNSGNFHAKSHKLRNTLIVAGIAGAALATMGAAGVFSGIGGAGAAGGGAAGTGAAIAAPAAGSTVASGLGTVAGLASPIAFGAPGAAATTALASGGGAALAGGLGAAGGVLASSPFGLGTAAGGLPTGATSSLGASSSGGGLLSTLKSAGQNLLSSKGAEAIGKGLAGASQASANNRGVQAELALDQNRDLESQLLAREREKRDAQDQAYRNAMLGDRAATWKPLVRPAGISGSYQGSTPQSQGAGSELFNQAMSRLTSPDLRNGQTGMPAYKNLSTDPTFQDNLKPGALETATSTGSWLLPLFSGIFGKK